MSTLGRGKTWASLGAAVLAIVAGIAMWVTIAIRASDDEIEHVLPAAEVARLEDARYANLAAGGR